MLVLTRKVGEKIIIKDCIHITVVAIKGEKVRIGVSAPKDVFVDRQEVHERRKDFAKERPALPPIPTIVRASLLEK